MPITIGSNIAALTAQRRLAESTNGLASVYERLSSGLRINRASDDAAGLAVSSSLRADARIFSQGIRNLNDGVSLLNVAASALTELSSLTTRQMELATQAANGTYGYSQRRAMQTEADALVNEYNRIISSVRFNGIDPFSRIGPQPLRLQAGFGSDGGIAFGIGDEISRIVGNGSFTERISSTNAAGYAQLADVNNDGNIDQVRADVSTGRIQVALGNGDGSFRADVSYDMVNWGREIALGDVNGDGFLDIVQSTDQNTVNVFLNTGSGTFHPRVSYVAKDSAGSAEVQMADMNGDGRLDIVTSRSADNQISILYNLGSGTFGARTTLTLTNTSAFSLADMNGDGRTDIVALRGSGGSSVNVLLSNGNGTFDATGSYDTGASVAEAITLSDFDGDGFLDVVAGSSSAGTGRLHVFLGNSDGTLRARSDYVVSGATQQNSIVATDYDRDGIMDLVSASFANNRVYVWRGNGDGSFGAQNSFATGGQTIFVSAGDIDEDGSVDLLVSNNSGTRTQIFLGGEVSVTYAERFNLYTQSGARSALSVLRDQLDRISRELGAIGSFEGRINVAANVLATSRENYLAADSRISDADIASETARLIRGQILQQVGASLLAQANQQPALALQLLRG